jgi:Cys-tRNA synthase (O-phospho-L-seryl-tRNA:Cys-tRNA synthase)
MITRRSSAPSSFVLAATRLRALQLDPLQRGGVTQAAARKIPEK